MSAPSLGGRRPPVSSGNVVPSITSPTAVTTISLRLDVAVGEELSAVWSCDRASALGTFWGLSSVGAVWAVAVRADSARKRGRIYRPLAALSDDFFCKEGAEVLRLLASLVTSG